ncbi:hypothetical protein V2J09_019067 [Rumex salicifolius]
MRLLKIGNGLYYGFHGSQAPPIPRGARSHRRRGPLRKKVVDSEMCAFDLLATIADKILLEESPTTDSSEGMYQEGNTLGIVMENKQLDDHKHQSIDFHDQCNVEIGLGVLEIPNHQGGFSSRTASAITNSDCTGKTAFDEKRQLNDGSSHAGSPMKKLEGCSSGYTVFDVPLFENHAGIGSDTCSSEDPEFLNRNLSRSDNYVYDTDVKVQLHGNHYTSGFPSQCRNNVKVVSKDDDDNSSECTKRSTMKNIGDKRFRQLVPARSSRVHGIAKGRDCSDSGVEMNSKYQNIKRGLKCQRSQRMYPFKKRKLLYSSPSTSDDTNLCDYEAIYEPLENATATSHLSEATGKSTLFTPKESHMKLRIKSFRVPELFIELPETATVGSLKKTVMDAIKTLLGGGLHIGVLVQGRKIKDDNTTLLQSGISQENKVESLGFTLEPNSICSKEPLSSSYAGLSTGKVIVDSKALVAKHESNAQALTLFSPPPVHKSKRSESGQRRIRRPFSVSEVEALVQAVEELGTGRWRDVKMRAFDNINHRTYVDLKDKWKTLVHTARISPQQRRGEPVPQDLLDRVLAAHSYWSHHHAKQQPDTCLLLKNMIHDLCLGRLEMDVMVVN